MQWAFTHVEPDSCSLGDETDRTVDNTPRVGLEANPRLRDASPLGKEYRRRRVGLLSRKDYVSQTEVGFQA